LSVLDALRRGVRKELGVLNPEEPGVLNEPPTAPGSVVDEETIRCIVCGERHTGRAGDCQTGLPGANLSPRRTADLMSTVRDEPEHGQIWCVRCLAEGKGNPVGWTDPREHQHDEGA
jgi:hypothetical protein